MSASGKWTTRGYEGFVEGTFDNAGQNLYVSRAGVLQRIHQFDVDGDGYLDLVICNSQDHWEKPPAYVYTDALSSAAPSCPPPGPCPALWLTSMATATMTWCWR